MSISDRPLRVARALFAGAMVVLDMSVAGCSGSDADADASQTPVDVGPCFEGDRDRERWGTSCLCCHAGEFGVAGSIAPDSGVMTVFVEDRDGRTAEMSPNIFDNFFRHRKLTPPLSTTITFADGEQRSMRAAPHGSCNGCHGVSVPLVGAK